MRSPISIKKTYRGHVPALPFARIATEILGSHYDLSLVICSDALAQRMNKKYRHKDYKPNVLSFPISKSDGEIFLNIPCAQREAKEYGIPMRQRVALLFVHGCFHLKGLDHGSKMEREESRILKMFRLATK